MRFLLAAAFIAILTPALADQNAMLVGTWYSEGVENSQDEQLIWHRMPDGTFWLDGRIIDQKDCRVLNGWRESGTAEIVDGVIVQVTSTVAGSPSDYHDRYRILSLGAKQMSWLDEETRVNWESEKVAANFPFPPPSNCNPTS